MVTTVNVTGYVKLPDNTAADGAIVQFTLSASDADQGDDTAIPKSTTSVTLGSGGALTAALWPNDRGAAGTRYAVDAIWTGSNGRPVTARLGSIQPVSGGSNDIADLLAAGGAGFDGIAIAFLTDEEYQAAVSAADILQAGVTYYNSTAEGLAATANGDYFIVKQSGGLADYLNDVGSATFNTWIKDPVFDTVADFLASGVTGNIGDVVTTRDGIGRYIKVADGTGHVPLGSPDWDVLTADVGAWGADISGVSGATAAIRAAIDGQITTTASAGEYLLDAKVGEIQSRAVVVRGEGHGTTFHVDNAENIGFRLGAIGSNDAYGGSRCISLFEDMNFTTYAKVDSTPVRGIDVQSVNPINLNRVRAYGLGPEAVTMRRLYYGAIRDCEFVKSGLRLQNVNNVLMSGGGFFGGASALPSASTMFGSYYPLTMTNDDTFRGPESVTFEQVVFESWSVPAVLAEVSNAIAFNSCWFEALTGDHLIKSRQSRLLAFNDCKFDLAYANSGDLILVDNSGPRTDAASLREAGRFVFRGGELRLKPTSGDAPKLVAVTGTEAVTAVLDGPTITRGDIYADPSVLIDVQGATLATDDPKTLYSTSLRASMTAQRNSWMPNSASSDWDFAAGANFTQKSGTTGLTIATTTTAGEFLTGTRGVKITGFTSDGVERGIARNTGTNGDMTKITVEGETFLFFVRLRSSQAVTLRLGVQGASLEYGKTQNHTIPANQWRDYVIKTSVADTWAQGRSFNPQLLISVVNTSGTSADLLLDRVDYRRVTGDVVL